MWAERRRQTCHRCGSLCQPGGNVWQKEKKRKKTLRYTSDPSAALTLREMHRTMSLPHSSYMHTSRMERVELIDYSYIKETSDLETPAATKTYSSSRPSLWRDGHVHTFVRQRVHTTFTTNPQCRPDAYSYVGFFLKERWSFYVSCTAAPCICST